MSNLRIKQEILKNYFKKRKYKEAIQYGTHENLNYADALYYIGLSHYMISQYNNTIRTLHKVTILDCKDINEKELAKNSKIEIKHSR